MTEWQCVFVYDHEMALGIVMTSGRERLRGFHHLVHVLPRLPSHKGGSGGARARQQRDDLARRPVGGTNAYRDPTHPLQRPRLVDVAPRALAVLAGATVRHQSADGQVGEDRHLDRRSGEVHQRAMTSRAARVEIRAVWRISVWALWMNMWTQAARTLAPDSRYDFLCNKRCEYRRR